MRVKETADISAQDVLEGCRGALPVEFVEQGEFLAGDAVQNPGQNFTVETCLVAEVVVHRGDIAAACQGDLADADPLEPLGEEKPGRGFQQGRPGVFDVGCW